MSLFFGGVFVSAVLFTFAYSPLMKLFLVLVSPYPKANERRRAFAAGADSLVVMTCWVTYWNGGSLPFAAAAVVYLLLRDSIGGQSVGKFLVGQVVIYIDTGQPCSLIGSIKRNLILVIPGVNLAAIFLEARTLIQDPQGQRLGDRLARTQVVEGLGVGDVVKQLQRRWAQFLRELPAAGGKPDRGRAVADR